MFNLKIESAKLNFSPKMIGGRCKKLYKFLIVNSLISSRNKNNFYLILN